MPEEKPASKEPLPESPKGKGKLPLIAGIVAGVLVLWGAGIFIAVKAFKGPAEAAGIEIPEKHAAEPADNPGAETVEIKIANLECPHTNTGRLYVVRMTVVAAVSKDLVASAGEGEGHGKEAKEGEGKESAGKCDIAKDIEDHIAQIKDRMRTIVASADPGTLCLARSEKPDYGLSTLRRQFKSILDEVLGKGKVRDVLISDYMPTPVD